ncbi:hypothetical protein SAMN06295987_1021, partial [Novosphingobium mathurense]
SSLTPVQNTTFALALTPTRSTSGQGGRYRMRTFLIGLFALIGFSVWLVLRK